MGPRYLDLTVATLLFLTSVCSSVFLYSRVTKTEQVRTKLSLPIGEDSKEFALNYLGKCIGHVQTDLTENKAPHLALKAELRDLSLPEGILGKLDWQASFNPIGQLVESTLSIALLDLTGSITTTGVNPILVTLDLPKQIQPAQRELTLSGPITLVKSARAGYRIEYLYSSAVSTLGAFEKLTTVLPISVAAWTGEECRGDVKLLSEVEQKLRALSQITEIL